MIHFKFQYNDNSNFILESNINDLLITNDNQSIKKSRQILSQIVT